MILDYIGKYFDSIYWFQEISLWDCYTLKYLTQTLFFHIFILINNPTVYSIAQSQSFIIYKYVSWNREGMKNYYLLEYSDIFVKNIDFFNQLSFLFSLLSNINLLINFVIKSETKRDSIISKF